MPIKTVNIIESLVDMASNIKEAHNNSSVSQPCLPIIDLHSKPQILAQWSPVTFLQVPR